MKIPTFIVFGAAGGIGTEVARSITRSDHRVVLVGRNAKKLAELSDELLSPSFEIDVSDPEAVEGVTRRVLEEHGRLDGMTNCAGSLLLKPAHLTSKEEWRATMRANLDPEQSWVTGQVFGVDGGLATVRSRRS